MNNQEMLSEIQQYKAGEAYREIVDRLYIIQDLAGFDEDWVKEKTQEIISEFEEKTNVNLEDL